MSYLFSLTQLSDVGATLAYDVFVEPGVDFDLLVALLAHQSVHLALQSVQDHFHHLPLSIYYDAVTSELHVHLQLTVPQDLVTHSHPLPPTLPAIHLLRVITFYELSSNRISSIKMNYRQGDQNIHPFFLFFAMF